MPLDLVEQRAALSSELQDIKFVCGIFVGFKGFVIESSNMLWDYKRSPKTSLGLLRFEANIREATKVITIRVLPCIICEKLTLKGSIFTLIKYSQRL